MTPSNSSKFYIVIPAKIIQIDIGNINIHLLQLVLNIQALSPCARTTKGCTEIGGIPWPYMPSDM
ncbi:hypothetical protein DERP_011143 [Dermatophagoides pteronyssinus]|uniref:Uncharacterized protein n=1 Tax=Dermatophagoides pteronyssinus TaxID=6956 RepID=A0ABQ8J8X5_DERPT|nr:hypothetical protein DERP_011143 [Dermatophagoides pteronyssinus]